MKKQQGFTLIELIVVIVILGILAATALPKFVDLSTDAKIAGIKGVAGALSSAGTINHANFLLHGSASAVTAASGTTTCSAFASLALDGGLPAGYTTGASVLPYCTVDTSPTATSAVSAYVTPNS